MLPVLQDAPQDFVDHDGVTWRRTGVCNRCGECCRSGDPFLGEQGPAKVKGACPLFAWESDGVGVCTDREAHYYKMACAHWPSHPTQITDYPSCSYVFTRVE